MRLNATVRSCEASIQLSRWFFKRTETSAIQVDDRSDHRLEAPFCEDRRLCRLIGIRPPGLTVVRDKNEKPDFIEIGVSEGVVSHRRNHRPVADAELALQSRRGNSAVEHLRVASLHRSYRNAPIRNEGVRPPRRQLAVHVVGESDKPGDIAVYSEPTGKSDGEIGHTANVALPMRSELCGDPF